MERIKSDLLVTEFLECLEERAEKYFKGRLEQAFIDWYVEAEFGQLNWEFTDGPKDGGIDTVVWRRPDDKPPVIILQSMFSQKVEEQKLAKIKYLDFRRVVEAFHRRGEVFDEFLEGVAPEIRRVYLKAFRLLDGNWLTEKKAFRLITTSGCTPRSEFKLIPTENFVYETGILNLYRQFRRVWTPKAQELIVTVHDKLGYSDPKRGMTSYLFNAKVSDFKKYLSLPRLGQILTVVSQDDGRGVITAKRGVDAIFDNRHYPEIFPSRSKVAHRFG